MGRFGIRGLAGRCPQGTALGALALGALVVCGCAARGAPWTIKCLELEGPNRLEQVEQIAETLKRTPGVHSRDVWFTDDPDGFARLYYGTYHRRTDPATGRRPIPPKMRQDLELIRRLAAGPGNYLFLRAMIARTPTPDVGNPAWVLTNAPGVYSLQVAVFEPTDDFQEHKRAAADFCEFLRKKGYEAYYYHTPACSTVTVGSFGAGAVIPQSGRLPVYSSEVVALQQEELLQYNLVNGAVVRPKTAEGVGGPIRSQLVEVPGRK